MNIIVPDSWLREFLKTDAKPQEISEALSLCTASVEKIQKAKNDFLYHIEITTNRVDMASIFGLAREAQAVLPRFGHKAKLRPLEKKTLISKIKPKVDYLEVKIADPSLCPRFTCLLLENVQIQPSSKAISQKLEKCGIRSLNNVVDVSNYVMLELGQPMHTFDYDKIKDHKMLMRLSRKGESIVTLDESKRLLPEGSIVIEDGKGRIIDLCGIMGGENSKVDQNTKRVLLFVQTYDPVRIRNTCQKMSFRTDAASLFEKSLDPQNIIPALKRAVYLLRNNSQAAPFILDIYPEPQKPKKVSLEISLVEKVLGVKISASEIQKILKSLGFESQFSVPNSELLITVPSYRAWDINIPEDLVEEIARLWGYHHLPVSLPQGAIPQNTKNTNLTWEEKVKKALKYWGFTETYNYSMISEDALLNCGFSPKESIRIQNPLTYDLVYMRPSLIPSLLLAVQKNSSFEENLRLFELSKIYLPQNNDLPNEKSMLCGILAGEKFSETKGTVESLLKETGIINPQFLPLTIRFTPNINLYHPVRTALVKTEKGDTLGIIGEVNLQILVKFGIKGRVCAFDLDFSQISTLATSQRKYHPIPQYPAIIEDLAIIVKEKIPAAEIIKVIKNSSPLISEVSILDIYENTRTFRLIYQSAKKTLTDKEAAKIRGTIIEALKRELNAQIKSLSGQA